MQLRQAQGRNQNQPQGGASGAQILVISGGKVGSGTCGGIQGTACVLHNQKR